MSGDAGLRPAAGVGRRIAAQRLPRAEHVQAPLPDRAARDAERPRLADESAAPAGAFRP